MYYEKKTMDHVQHTHNDSICNIMTYLDSSSDKSSFKASITVAWRRIIENLKSDLSVYPGTFKWTVSWKKLIQMRSSKLLGNNQSWHTLSPWLGLLKSLVEGPPVIKSFWKKQKNNLFVDVGLNSYFIVALFPWDSQVSHQV